MNVDRLEERGVNRRERETEGGREILSWSELRMFHGSILNGDYTYKSYTKISTVLLISFL